MTGKKDQQKDINEKYWKAQREAIVKDEYQKFLKEKDITHSKEAIEQFTIPLTQNGQIEYQGFTEKELIKLLGGEVPDYY